MFSQTRIESSTGAAPIFADGTIGSTPIFADGTIGSTPIFADGTIAIMDDETTIQSITATPFRNILFALITTTPKQYF